MAIRCPKGTSKEVRYTTNVQIRYRTSPNKIFTISTKKMLIRVLLTIFDPNRLYKFVTNLFILTDACDAPSFQITMHP